MKFPKHKCGLHLEHNAYLNYYDNIDEALQDVKDAFKTDEAFGRSRDTKEVWTLQWYPRTPICFHLVAAPTLKELLEFALEMDNEL